MKPSLKCFTQIGMGACLVIFLVFFLVFFSLFAFVNQAFAGQVQKSYENAQFLKDDINSIIGVELLIAQPSKRSLMSRWGHTLIHFVDKRNLTGSKWQNDFVLSFVANLENEKTINYAKGLTGGYKVLPEIKTFDYYYYQYTAREQRSLSRYILQLTPTQIKDFILYLSEEFQNLQKQNYTFLSKNCAGVLAQVFRELKLGTILTYTHTPSRLPQKLSESALIVQPASSLHSFSSETVFLNNQTAEHPLSLNELSGYQILPEYLYQACSTTDCALKIKDFWQSQTAPQLENQDLWKSAEKLQQDSYNELATHYISKEKRKADPQFQNLLQFLKIQKY